MQVGDLVTLDDGFGVYIGVIVQQVGSCDRWFVHWNDGTVMGHNGYTLELICKQEIQLGIFKTKERQVGQG